MKTKDFIEKAIDGGWEFNEKIATKGNTGWLLDDESEPFISVMFLDPKAWEAVGKVEGWFIDESENFHANYEWELKMHQMIDALIKGDTIEDYLKTL